ncbi:disease resistance protein RUN1-like [Rosa rugosa]|uniref:disease resistance protein RUN1-like n=1 Tax=Rosa rugosa TaxID=74645 RepID=UPI002B402CBE|nr:disease resistance protein RUN1-like [Rosa rugosa]
MRVLVFSSMLPMATSRKAEESRPRKRKADESSSSSDSSSSNHWIYEVFLSFRGEDTRNTFTGHLYLALKDAGINAFIDDNELRRGENITEELVRAIQGSKISVIVFSRKYAESSWCLEELVNIMDCRTTLGQRVFPLFYHVDPSDVRKQSGSFAEAFDQKHGDKDEDKVKRWRAALTEAANLSGWDLKTKADGHEGNFIRMIIKEITKYLNNTDLNVADNEVGIDSRMQDIISHLGVGTSHDVRIVGICGMGGIGKTTVAKALYNKFRQSFEASSFLPDVRETAMQNNGMVSLQESLLSDISKTSMAEVRHDDRGINVIKNRIGCRRVFVVIDDVDQVEQLKALAIGRDSFGLGSRVLITTRDEHLLKQLSVESIYQVRLMDEEESIKLFSLHAFKTHCPPNEEYLRLSRRVVYCCGGLPLALKVLGSFLVQRSPKFWESEIKKLQTIPPLEVQEKLKISFDGLNDDIERDIFLDISCFHIGKKMDIVKQILDSCDLFPDSGIQVLVQRCLVIVNNKNELMMHDLLRDMGRAIVRAKCRDNPGKWSRVWRSEDAVEVLRDESGSDEIQGLTLDMWSLESEKRAKLRTKAFAKMKRLRFLELGRVELTGGYKYLPNKLRWLHWTEFPLKFIPKDFHLGEAVAIYLPFSKLIYVWEDSGVLAKLKILNLSDSYSLKQSPDFSTIPNLEELVLKRCWKLAEVHQSIGGLKRLSLLNLEGCKILEELPRSFYKLKSIVTLVLNGCERFEKLDEEIGDMTSLSTLRANCTALPSSIVTLKNLKCLSLLRWSSFREIMRITSKSLLSTPNFPNLNLPPSVQGLSSLVDLSINGCNIPNVPKDLGSLSSLKSLDIRRCYLQSLPSLRGLSQLEDLCLVDCNLTDELIKVMDLGSLSSLKLLDLDDNGFSSLPSLRSLSKLVDLGLRRCTNLVAIPDLPTSLTDLRASECTALEVMPDLDESVKSSLRLLEMEGCINITATFKEKILQGYNFVHNFGIFLPPSDIPEWFPWVNEGGRINFQVPAIRGSNVIAITLCFTLLKDDIREPKVVRCGLEVANHTKLTRYYIASTESGHESCPRHYEYLWLGHFPSYSFNLEGGDFVEVLITSRPSFGVKKSGVSLVWDTKQPELCQGR